MKKSSETLLISLKRSDLSFLVLFKTNTPLTMSRTATKDCAKLLG